MANLTIALVFVLAANALLVLANASVEDMNPAISYYNLDGACIGKFGDAETLIIDGESIPGYFPESEGSVEPTSGEGFFTDLFGSIKNWAVSLPGISHVYCIVMSPYNMLKIMGLPEMFNFVIGALWYGLTIFLIVAFFWGRDA